MQSVTAIILAGERLGGDPFAREAGYPAKALIPLGGQPLVRRVIEAAEQVPAISSIRVLAQQPDLIAPALAGTRAAPGRSEATIAQTIRAVLAEGATDLLITTADNGLVTEEMLACFLSRARGADVAVGLVERGTLLRAYPESRRTWLKFRGGAYSGANLFWIAGRKVLPLLDLWAEVEQQRKRGRAVIGMLGPMLSLAVMLRLLTLDQALARAGKRLGLRLTGVVLPFPEACIDVDKVADLALAEQIVSARTAA